MSRALRWVPLFVPVLLAGCLMSEQTGRPPDDVTFHFFSWFNALLMVVRIAMVVVLVRIVRTLARDRPVPWPILVPSILALAGSVYLTAVGAVNFGAYRIRCTDAELTLHVPFRVWRTVPWDRVDGIEIEGVHKTATEGPGAMLLPEGYTEWGVAHLSLRDDEVSFDLKRLSPEQRSNLGEIIVIRGGMGRWDRDGLAPDPWY